MVDSISNSSSTLSGDSVSMLEPSPLAALTAALSLSPHAFLLPSQALQSTSLSVAKQLLDPLAASITTSRSRNRKKKAESAVLDQIYLDGFDVEQVWQQVKVLVREVEDVLEQTTSKPQKSATMAAAIAAPTTNGKKRKAVHFEPSEDEASDAEESDPEGAEDKHLGSSEEEEDEELSDGSDIDEEENSEIELQDDDMEGMEQLRIEDGDEEDSSDERREVFVKDVHGLNDGFFSIDEFNKQTDLFEQLDYHGEQAQSDDEEDEIDYNVDPEELELVMPNKNRGGDDGDDDDESEDEDDFDDGLDEDGNANEIMYNDFFNPPPKKGLSKAQRAKNSWKNEAPKKNAIDEESELARIESDMARVHRDIFDEDLSEHESDQDFDAGDPAGRKSAHDRRQAALIEEIRRLENANVAKKQWTLSGEARANQRPLNSLLEEDLDFERIGKPVPVITQDVTEDLEAMIKRRIIAGQFDELQKRRPEDVSSDFKRGRFELDDSKPQKSLAEIYETEHLQSTDPANNPDAQDENYKKQCEEITGMFNDLTRKLDSLSSWHYTPKPPKPSLTVVSDAPAITMEEVQPTVAAGGAAAAEFSMLAPQEVYNPVKDRKEAPRVAGEVREVIGKSGAPISTAEMTTEEKQKIRKRNKERARKENAATGNTHGGKAKEGTKRDVLDTLKKGGVKVIGKGGEKRDVSGKEVKDKRAASSNTLKL